MHPVVYMITDRRRLGERAGAALIRRVAAAARAGMHLIQIRERDMSDGELLTLVMQAVEAVRGTRTRILVNDRVDVAMVAGAHGVHLRADSAPARRCTQSGAAIVSDRAFSAHARRDLAGLRMKAMSTICYSEQCSRRHRSRISSRRCRGPRRRRRCREGSAGAWRWRHDPRYGWSVASNGMRRVRRDWSVRRRARARPPAHGDRSARSVGQSAVADGRRGQDSAHRFLPQGRRGS